MWITGARSGQWLQHMVGADTWAREEGRAVGREPCGQQGTATRPHLCVCVVVLMPVLCRRGAPWQCPWVVASALASQSIMEVRGQCFPRGAPTSSLVSQLGPSCVLQALNLVCIPDAIPTGLRPSQAGGWNLKARSLERRLWAWGKRERGWGRPQLKLSCFLGSTGSSSFPP